MQTLTVPINWYWPDAHVVTHVTLSMSKNIWKLLQLYCVHCSPTMKSPSGQEVTQTKAVPDEVVIEL
jgi:hypothetical protein